MPPPRSRPRTGAGTGARTGSGSVPRRRVALSLEAVVTEAVALLDQAGEQALTFRALAARLDAGVASIYWYVANRDELLDRATDHVLAGVLINTEPFAGRGDPIDDVRDMAVTFFDAIVDRPWLAAYFMRDTGIQSNSLLLFERLGEQVMRLGLTPRQSFHAISAVLGFVIGTAADLGQQPPQEVLDGDIGRDEFIARYADTWRELDPEAFPFMHHIVDEFAVHEDAEQFRAGLDLLLAGLRLQAGR